MKNRKVVRVLLIAVILFITFLYGCTNRLPDSNKNRHTDNKNKGILSVHYIDVGQADSILVESPSGKTMLIDAGNNDDDEKIIKYLNEQNVTKIDILVGTHPHEDHIGAMDSIIKKYDIGSFYMPKVTTSTKTFSDVINAAKSKGLGVNVAKKGAKLDLGTGIDVFMLSPVEDKYEDLNDYSAVIKLNYGKISFLFTGDAGKIPEEQMIEKGEDLKAAVLKVGHHGSSSATSDKFLKAVNPEYAVISVGKGNTYGHPEQGTLDKLKQKGVMILRTDEKGNIVFSTDGDRLNQKSQK